MKVTIEDKLNGEIHINVSSVVESHSIRIEGETADNIAKKIKDMLFECIKEADIMKA